MYKQHASVWQFPDLQGNKATFRFVFDVLNGVILLLDCNCAYDRLPSATLIKEKKTN